jgi:hypothetical protein
MANLSGPVRKNPTARGERSGSCSGKTPEQLRPNGRILLATLTIAFSGAALQLRSPALRRSIQGGPDLTHSGCRISDLTVCSQATTARRTAAAPERTSKTTGRSGTSAVHRNVAGFACSIALAGRKSADRSRSDKDHRQFAKALHFPNLLALATPASSLECTRSPLQAVVSSRDCGPWRRAEHRVTVTYFRPLPIGCPCAG